MRGQGREVLTRSARVDLESFLEEGPLELGLSEVED